MAICAGKELPAVLRITRWLMLGVTVNHTPWLMSDTATVGLRRPVSVA